MTLLTLGTCAGGLRYLVCVCVCLCMRVTSPSAAKGVYITKWTYRLGLR